MPETLTQGPLILGATGRVGQALRLAPADCWHGTPIWQSRQKRNGYFHWDILVEEAPPVACSGVIMLAGAADSPSHVHAELAHKAAALGARLRVRVLIASTQAVYGPQMGRLDEDKTCQPLGAYGIAKLAMEHAVAGQNHVTCLRMGNIVGTDMLGQAATRGDVVLDQLATGRAPRRAMIGPVSLARALTALLSAPKPLPQTLNLAQPGMVAMDDLLAAASVPWGWRPAPDTVLPALDLDVSKASGFVDIAPADPIILVAEARSAGWLM